MSLNKQQALILQAAIDIGTRLCATAFWDEEENQCNWISRLNIDDPQKSPLMVRTGALGPDLYSGSTGVALFLIELWGITKNTLVKQTALGALRRSIISMKEYFPLTYPGSFFSGDLGLIYTIHRFMDIDPTIDFASDIQWLIKEVISKFNMPHYLDIINGNAGAIPVLLALSQHPELQFCKELALRYGEELCDKARWDKQMCMFEGNPELVALTGFSHGVSGIACSLLQLYAHTGNQKFLNVARGAFAFEDTLFKESDNNWIDTRSPYWRENGALQGMCQVAWCHGAPGIALAHALAKKLDLEFAGYHEKMMHTALQTTTNAITQLMQRPGYDTTLCHGLTGLTEIILTCGELLGEVNKREIITLTVLELIQRYGASGNWPSGVNTGGPNLSLMIGNAGIGYHFLRLNAPRIIPSILFLGFI